MYYMITHATTAPTIITCMSFLAQLGAFWNWLVVT